MTIGIHRVPNSCPTLTSGSNWSIWKGGQWCRDSVGKIGRRTFVIDTIVFRIFIDHKTDEILSVSGKSVDVNRFDVTGVIFVFGGE
uniref:Uncharacterized protein n=1 Tax=Romanomermis culicivorax TaxID=13658 RepID=A0A915JXG1_ROMCU